MATNKMIIQVGEDVIEASDEMKNYIVSTQKEIQDMETQRISKEDELKQAILSKLNITSDEAKLLGL
jgi:adenylate kinase